VTVFADECNGQKTRSYVAVAYFNLPTSFSDGHTHTEECSALQLHVNGSVASILVVYKNFTVVIRQKDFMLSITLQVPGQDTFFSQGLCSGCPQQQAVGKYRGQLGVGGRKLHLEVTGIRTMEMQYKFWICV